MRYVFKEFVICACLSEMVRHVGLADVSKVTVEICFLTPSSNKFCPFLFEHTQTNRQLPLLCTNPSNTNHRLTNLCSSTTYWS